MNKACVLVFATLVFAALAVAPRPSAGDAGASDNTPPAGSDAGTPGATDPSLVHPGTGGQTLPPPPAAKPAEAAGAGASPKIKKTEQGCCGGAVYDNKSTTVQ